MKVSEYSAYLRPGSSPKQSKFTLCSREPHGPGEFSLWIKTNQKLGTTFNKPSFEL